MPPTAEPELSPAMRQHRAAKEAYPDALLFFRMGDFYELFYDDAIVAARELQLTLTARDKAKLIPLCGVPYHAAGPYIQRLLRLGYRVAMCEQMEDPKFAKGVVKREVTRVLTPGTALDTTLSPSESQWLAAVTAINGTVGVASIDLSTGDFRTTEFSGKDAWPAALDELSRINAAEVLSAKNTLPTDADQSSLPEENQSHVVSGAKTEIDDWAFTPDYAVPLLQQQLRVHSLDGMGLATHQAAAVAAGAIVHYLRATKQGALEHLDTLRYYEQRDCLELDAVSVRNLELVEPLFSSEGPQTTLFHTLDACCTPMGKRLLRAQLLRPMQSLESINQRLDAVAQAAVDLRRRESLRRAMDGVLDLERLLGRVALDSAGAREVAALGSTLSHLPNLRSATSEFIPGAPFMPGPHPGMGGVTMPIASTTNRWATLHTTFDPLADLHEIILATLTDEPPNNIADGNTIRPGVDAELDELRVLSTNGRQMIAAIEERERERTGISSLKVRFNNVFGYYIEITKANAKSAPADYERKQTLVNAERFTTPELKELETKILTAQDRSQEIERRIFFELRRQLLADAARIRETSRHIAEIDLLANFAHLAALRGWTRPTVNDSGLLELVAARHPVIERRMEETSTGRFIPNSLHLCASGLTSLATSSTTSSEVVILSEAKDLLLDRSGDNAGAPRLASGDLGSQDVAAPQEPSLLLITGPNMGGKSTYLRMAALLTIMAQCGSFVPADSMTLGLVDRVYTRIGASDNVARGRSTFMVEMTETAAILNTATSRSLVLLDEMGRGTATYDGLSLAWAAVEHLHDAVGARTLFATHYHELTLLADRLSHLRNVRVTVRENANGIVFLHTVESGAANKSYGIEVARLAGLPTAVVQRAREVLKLHERAESQQVREALTTPEQKASLQMTMFTPLSQRIVDRIEATDIDGLTPRDALQLLADLQRELKGSA